MTTIDMSGYRLAAASRYRRERFKRFAELVHGVPDLGHPLRILDVGGVQEYWDDKKPLLTRPVEVTLLSTDIIPVTRPGFRLLHGDACQMAEIPDHAYDVVHSNSVIEHVGPWSRMMAMANEIRRVAPRYFVQTPYFWFPIEPHARTPFLHWLPESLKFRLVMARQCGPYWTRGATVDAAMRTIQSATLLDKAMFAALFPDAAIVAEKAFGMTKSLMAIKGT